MNKSEFNDFSLLQLENDSLRARLIEKDREIQSLKTIIDFNEHVIKILEKKIQEKNENDRQDLHTK
jgi:hypothetical protein